MPFQPINFANIAPQGNSAMRDFVDNLASGYKAGQMPAQMQRKREQEELMNKFKALQLQQEPQRFQSQQQGQSLANQLKQMELQQSPQRFQSDLQGKELINALNQAKIGEIERKGNLPFGGNIAPGSVGQAMWLNAIEKNYGKESPEFQRAEEAYKADITKSQVLNDYRQKLGNSTDKRGATPLGKTEMEIEDIKAGFVPGTGRSQPFDNPAMQEEMLNRYDLQRQKQISDADTRKRSLFATNIDKTLQNINVDDLTRYAGVMGAAELKKQEGLAAFGKESQAYDNYQSALKAAKLLAKQVRQFYGDSIQPEMQNQLAELTNPATWTNNPKLAKNNFNTFAKILQQETGTYKGALTSTDEFKKQGASGNQKIWDLGKGGWE